MRNVEGDFDPNRLIFVDFDLAAYGARAFDINYHTSYWLPDWGELDFFYFFSKQGSTDQNRSVPVSNQQKISDRTGPDKISNLGPDQNQQNFKNLGPIRKFFEYEKYLQIQKWNF